MAKTEKLKDGDTLDLEPSCYVVPSAMEEGIARMHSEHLTILSNAPNKSPRWHVDARGLPHRGLVSQPGATRFEFTQNAHVCLALDDEQDVDRFAAALFEIHANASEVPMNQLIAYARERYEARDAEWVAFVDGLDPRRKKEWLKWINRKAG